MLIRCCHFSGLGRISGLVTESGWSVSALPPRVTMCYGGELFVF